MTTLTSRLLDKETEQELIKDAQNGSQEARKILMERNQGLVHKIVQKFPLKNAQCSYEDLWQVGCMGFLHAVDLFEVDRDLRLSTYAFRWVSAYVRRYYQNHGRVVRIPAHLADKKYQMDRKVQELTHSLGYTPSPEEVEEFVPGYAKMLDTFTHTVSLNQELESGEEVLDLQKDDDHTDLVLHVNSLLDLLKENVSARDYNIFVTRYGVDGRVEHTLNEVAEENGITRARVHQVTSRCLSLLKDLAD